MNTRLPVVVETLDQALYKVEAAFTALAEAVDFQSTRQIQTMAVAAAAYAREAQDKRLIQLATELQVRAERKAGQMLRAAAENGERDAGKGGDRKSPSDETRVISTLAEIGITYDQSSRWQQLAKVSEPVFEETVTLMKDVTASISTNKVLKAVRAAHQADAMTIDEDEGRNDEPLIQPLEFNAEEQAGQLYRAVRELAAITCSAEALRDALPFYQHFRIVDNIDAALRVLKGVKASWKTTTTTVPTSNPGNPSKEAKLT